MPLKHQKVKIYASGHVYVDLEIYFGSDAGSGFSQSLLHADTYNRRYAKYAVYESFTNESSNELPICYSDQRSSGTTKSRRART